MNVVLSKISDGIATITLNRPEKRNALSSELVAALTLALVQMEQDANVILLQGAGKSFCAGADLKGVADLATDTEIRAHAEATGKLFQTLGDTAIPVIASVQGHALGAGCGLVSLCDLVVAEPQTKFGYPELGHGMIPALVTPPLVRAVGKRHAFRLLTQKTTFSADEALDVGLISEIAAKPEIAAAMIARKLTAAQAGQLARFKALINQCGALNDPKANLAAIEANIADRLSRRS